ncbi:MAG: hypothetical protein LBC97_15770 [Bifidobacteriaceae bacterium]|jgi:hypothetical protein|nr:hypothetical protein [Bifidobacteriaceae bacterium]
MSVAGVDAMADERGAGAGVSSLADRCGVVVRTVRKKLAKSGLAVG